MTLAVHALTKAYGGKTVIGGLDYVFPQQRVTCIMGASGSGKTTLLRLLMGLEKPDGGSIAGFENRRLSAVFQEDRLCMNLSAVSNVRLVCPAHIRRADISAALEALGLAGSLRQPVRTLSGGMRRRVALARALMADYEILFLDEPFKGLDEMTRERTVAFTQEKAKGKTVLCVTHDPREAQMLDAQILQLEKKRY